MAGIHNEACLCQCDFRDLLVTVQHHLRRETSLGRPGSVTCALLIGFGSGRFSGWGMSLSDTEARMFARGGCA